MQNTETVVGQIADVAGCFVSAVTGAQIIYAAFRSIRQFFPARVPRVTSDKATSVDFVFRLPVMSSHRLIIQSRSVDI